MHVVTITAAGIVAPRAGNLISTHTALLALAIGAGSLFGLTSTMPGLWLGKEPFGLTVGRRSRAGR